MQGSFNASNRRVFMMQVALGGSALTAASAASAQAMVSEKDAQAASLISMDDIEAIAKSL